MSTDSTRDVSRLFQALSNRYRRVVLYCLREHGTASFPTLTDAVTGWVEAGPGADESTSHQEVRVQLHHVHLPALESAGLVRYDADAGTVTLVGLSPAAEELLDAALDADTSAARLDLERVLAAVDDGGSRRSGESVPGECADDGVGERGDDGGDTEDRGMGDGS